MARKRGNNEGTISQRKDGRWEARISVGVVDGKIKRKCIYGKTRKEVQDKMTSILRDLNLGLPVANDRLRIGQLLDDWLETVVKPSKRPKTYVSYRGIVEIHLKPGLGHIPVTRLTAKDVQKFLNDKLGSPAKPKSKMTKLMQGAAISPRTVQYMRDVLRNALNQAIRWDMVTRNVAELARPPTVPKHQISSLTPEQAGALLKAARGDRLEALYSVVLAIGLRIGEATGLRWNDVDFRAKTLRVSNQLQRIDREWRLVAPKTKSGARTVVLPGFAVEALKAHRERQDLEKVEQGDAWFEMGYVFTRTDGQPLDDSVLRRLFAKLLEKAELPPMRFHDLRHTCASLLLAQKVPPRVVMDILGHSQISLTMNTYSHVIPALEQEAADLMDGLLAAK